MAAFPQYIPVYLEQRLTALSPATQWVVSLIWITDGTLQDVKSTSTFVWMKGEEREEQYQLQGSIYRWLDALNLTSGSRMISSDQLWTGQGNQAQPRLSPEPYQIQGCSLMSLKETQHWMETAGTHPEISSSS